MPDTSLPERWESMWGDDAPTRVDLQPIKRQSALLASQISLVPHRETFGSLVGSKELREAPVHRWFSYKEGFSPRLLPAVIEALHLDNHALRVLDAFGGVATTAVAGRAHPQVAEVRSLEYSPWARFAGATKLAWPELNATRLRRLLADAAHYKLDYEVAVPKLAAFSNPKIFHHRRVRSLLSAREHLRALPGASSLERAFFLLGLGAVVEDLSYAMKDGRALRIKGERKRRASSLATHPHPALTVPGHVRQCLVAQWTAMIEDLEELADHRASAGATPAVHLAGDARELSAARMPDGSAAFPAGWGDLSCFSPPYLNCIDYSELYKLELWLMEYVASNEQFRETRLGTLRSHPSVKFEPRNSFADFGHEPVVQLVQATSAWLSANGARRDVGPVVQTYFEDMFEVWQAQHRVLADGGVAVCVVANSTFARRDRSPDGTHIERWRLPLLTDVVLAHLAQLAGFGRTELWDARALRPRNVRAGAARESLVVAYK